jgi:hypothetical protein
MYLNSPAPLLSKALSVEKPDIVVAPEPSAKPMPALFLLISIELNLVQKRIEPPLLFSGFYT